MNYSIFYFKPIFVDGKLPSSVSKSELPVDWDHFHVLLEGILHRVPSMGNAVLERLTNGPEPFSADGNWILGHAPEVRSYMKYSNIFMAYEEKYILVKKIL